MGKGAVDLKQEKLIENFFLLSHNGTHEDIEVQIIGHCDPNDQEDRVFYLDTLHSKLQSKTSIKVVNKLIQYFNEYF